VPVTVWESSTGIVSLLPSSLTPGQSQLGHASIQTTLDRYGYLLPATHKAAAQRLDQALFNSAVSNVSNMLTNGSAVGVRHKGESPEAHELAGLS
jgi:hypothetical protein